MTITIYGGITLRGQEYLDMAIASLVGQDIRGWKPAGDQSDEETSIVVDVDGKHRVFDFVSGNMLRKALDYIEKQSANNLTPPVLTREHIEKMLDHNRLQLAMKPTAKSQRKTSMGMPPRTSWWSLRRSGKTQTWKTRPNDWRIPVKYGFKLHGELTQDCIINGKLMPALRIDPAALIALRGLTEEEKRRLRDGISITWNAIGADAESCFPRNLSDKDRVEYILEMIIDADRPVFNGRLSWDDYDLLSAAYKSTNKEIKAWLRDCANY